MIAALLLAAALPASAAPAPKTNWIKAYPMTAYREAWTGELSVKKLDAAMPKVVAAVEKNGGRLTQPLSSFVASADARQVSFVLPLDSARKALSALRKLGKAPDPAVRAIGEKVPLDEVRSKLRRLSKEKNDNPVAFAQVPLTAEIVDELIENLANVEAVARTAPSEVLWNLTVREAR